MPHEPGGVNRLAGETSPYLLQHAHNPVDWYPWGEEAFARARAENLPILLSVGYSSCHWCHVMAHESFENDTTADLMNRWFVNIKVDREERPDVDAVYMNAVQALTGRGGWPMTVFLTPDLRPFYAGTYFPPEDRHGLPGFPRVLEALHNVWETEHERILAQAEGITDHLRQAANRVAAESAPITPSMATAAVEGFRATFDATWGGFGQAPKFPSPSNLEFLLFHHSRAGWEGTPTPLGMVLVTLHCMASGGMYDQLGGGFARYSVDERWLVPHFEKMLYDNAQLARAYLHAYQMSGDISFVRIVRDTLGYLEREMLDPEGGFYAAQDADSEGIEGKFFVWTPAEVVAELGEDDGALFCQFFGVTGEGNFRDPHHPEFGSRSVLTRWREADDVAREHGLSRGDLLAKIDGLRARMLAVRDRRVRPGLDDKVLTSWNGLALAAFADCGRVLGDARLIGIAAANAAFVRDRLWSDGRLLHTYKLGIAKVDGMLEDYAFYGLGLVELYRATCDIAHLEWARELFEVMLSRFADAERGGFFETAEGSEDLLVRNRPLFDQATPGGNGAAAQLAIWLGRYYGRPEWEAIGADIVASAGKFLTEMPSGFGSTLLAGELLLAPRQELVIVGEPEARAQFERLVAGTFRPWVVFAPGRGDEPLPLFEGRTPPSGKALAYVCEDMVCALPAQDADELRVQLAKR
ncbi:MAG: thioredoxin domain-containing protein [Thermoflexaceae bacterium]|nr:thioredoxin domain-containing protein [Thermoflexaceae bacterium]